MITTVLNFAVVGIEWIYVIHHFVVQVMYVNGILAIVRVVHSLDVRAK